MRRKRYRNESRETVVALEEQAALTKAFEKSRVDLILKRLRDPDLTFAVIAERAGVHPDRVKQIARKHKIRRVEED